LHQLSPTTLDALLQLDGIEQACNLKTELIWPPISAKAIVFAGDARIATRLQLRTCEVTPVLAAFHRVECLQP
jgi:hypothetical protein